jgi:hypothetical protein
VQVTIQLNIPESVATQFYREYLKLVGFHDLTTIYEAMGDKISVLVQLYQNLIERTRRSIDQILNAVDIAANKLRYIDNLHLQVKVVNNLNDRKLYLLKDVDFLTAKISKLQETVYSLKF